MRFSLLYGPFCLSFRKTLDLDTWRTDPRGLSGSEMCAVRLYQELQALGHDVEFFSIGNGCSPWEKRGEWTGDVAISINVPDDLRGMRAKVRVCYALLNDFSFCKVGFEEHVDLFLSPSAAHRDQCLNNPDWRKVEVTPDHSNGKAQWDPSGKPWAAVALGCDPERYDGFEKVPGRVVYVSSPDRGLHLLLQEWPKIRKAAPHATLKVFYRVRDWINSWAGVPFYPSIERQRQRAIYIDECLRRLEGYGVELVDAVSREQLERELGQAEVLAFPCDPVNNFTEGFSVATLEGCAARACPVISDADALGSIYHEACVVVPRGRWDEWREHVIDVLRDEKRREHVNRMAVDFARRTTWSHTTQRIMNLVQERL